jgi:hypothetical protein
MSANVTVPTLRPRSLRSCQLIIRMSALCLEVLHHDDPQRSPQDSTPKGDLVSAPESVSVASVPRTRRYRSQRMSCLSASPRASRRDMRRPSRLQKTVASVGAEMEAYLPRNASRQVGHLDHVAARVPTSPVTRVRVVRRAAVGLRVASASTVAVVSVGVSSSSTVSPSSTSAPIIIVVSVSVTEAAAKLAVMGGL